MPQCRIRSLAPSSPYFSLARSSPEIAPPRRSEEICRQLLLSLHLLARSSLARVLSFSSSVYLFPARTLTRHCAAAAASTHFGLTCHFFTLSLSSSLSCSCSSSSSLARTPSCYVLWEFGYPPRWLQSEIEWMDRIIQGVPKFLPQLSRGIALSHVASRTYAFNHVIYKSRDFF